MIIKYIILVKLVIKTMAPPCRYESNCKNIVDGTCPFHHTEEEVNRALKAFIEDAATKAQLKEENARLRIEAAAIAARPNTEVSQYSLVKTVNCKHFAETGECPYGGNCKFAHGPDDLRPKPPSNLKTKMCDNWKRDGTCPFGEKCKFAHGDGDLRPMPSGYRPRTATLEKKLGELTLG